MYWNIYTIECNKYSSLVVICLSPSLYYFKSENARTYIIVAILLVESLIQLNQTNL